MEHSEENNILYFLYFTDKFKKKLKEKKIELNYLWLLPVEELIFITINCSRSSKNRLDSQSYMHCTYSN